MNKSSITPFLDLIFCLLLIYVCIVMLLRITVKQEGTPAFQQNAIYLIVLTWQGNDDVDLWVRDPQGRLVGFNRREGGEGSLFSLNRDNLGASQTEVNDQGQVVTLVNEEIVAVRGTFPGEYACNSFLYTRRDTVPTKVTVKLMRVKPHAELMSREIVLTRNGDQHTHFRFTVDKDGNIVGFNELPAALFGSNQ